MAKKTNSFDLPPNTIIDLVGFNGKKRSVFKGITIAQATEKIQELKSEKDSKGNKKWRKWRFQMFQQGLIK